MATQASAKAAETTALHELAQHAATQKLGGLAYAGEVSPQDVYEFTKNNYALVVDVRTHPEWHFVGLPDFSATQAQLLTISWKLYPSFAQNPQFADLLLVPQSDITKDTPIFFLCRSGGRSLDAAVAIAALGYNHCFNVAGGFEGDTNIAGQRGKDSGWKAANLPWVQG